MEKAEILKKLKGGLIVSCQALQGEPLYGSYFMSRMAYAAKLGGAVGIRANGRKDIIEIRNAVDLPVIGIIKKDYSGSSVFITPTVLEIMEVLDSGADIIAADATKRIRPNGQSLETFFRQVKERCPDAVLMADCSDFEEGMYAQELGFDIVGTTLCGYTEYTNGTSPPDYELIESLSKALRIPLFAEGGIWSPDQLEKVFSLGAYAAVIGTAITRPRDITKRFVDAIQRKCGGAADISRESGPDAGEYTP